MRYLLGFGVMAGLVACQLALAQNQRIQIQERQAVPANPQGQADPDGDGFYRASELIGTTVHDHQKQALGQIKDLVIDARTDMVLYAVVDFNRIAEIRQKLIVVPWPVMTVQFGPAVTEHFVIIDVPRQRLLQAPAFTAVQLRDLRRPVWMTEVNTFFDFHPEQHFRAFRPGFDRDRPFDRNRTNQRQQNGVQPRNQQRQDRPTQSPRPQPRDSQQQPRNVQPGTQPDADAPRTQPAPDTEQPVNPDQNPNAPRSERPNQPQPQPEPEPQPQPQPQR